MTIKTSASTETATTAYYTKYFDRASNVCHQTIDSDVNVEYGHWKYLLKLNTHHSITVENKLLFQGI